MPGHTPSFILHGALHGVPAASRSELQALALQWGFTVVDCDNAVHLHGSGLPYGREDIPPMLHSLQRIGASLDGSGVITYGWEHLEPVVLHLGLVLNQSPHRIQEALKIGLDWFSMQTRRLGPHSKSRVVDD